MTGVLTREQWDQDRARNRLIVRRTRVGLGIGLATVTLFTITNHLAVQATRRGDALNLIVALLIGVAFVVFTLPGVQHRPVPHALLVFASGCGFRALAGVWSGEVATTAIMLMGLALMTAAAIPWGVIPQITMASIAGAAIALNSYMVDGALGSVSGHAATAVGLGLAVSVVLAIELERHRVQMSAENVGRRRAEERLAQLNAELEQRVIRRTEALDATTHRLEREVREHRLAIDGMRESQRRLQEVLDHAMVAIYLRDVEGRYVLVNRYWEALAGRRAAEVVGKYIGEIVPAHELEALQAHDRRVIESGTAMQFEETIELADGVHTYVSVKFPQFDGDGHPVGVWGISTDISERKQMEAERQRSEAALSALIESTNDAVWSVDRDYQVVAMNSAVKRHFAQVFGELQPGELFADHLSEKQRRSWRDLYDRVFAGERLTTERTVKVGGVTQHFLISMSPIREGSEVTGATVFSHDISELRHTEELARAHQAELTHVLRLGTLGEIASALAHEINQPLGAISNCAAACSRWIENGRTRPRDQQRALEMIASEAIRAGEIIRRLRDLARKGEGSVQVVDVNGIVRRAAELMKPETRLRGISLRVEAGNDLPRVCADAIQIEQVVLNLLLNGVEAMQTSSLKKLSVSTAINSGHVVVLVRDSGVGLAPSVREHVFDAFFTTKANGLGMGLAISRRIVDAHGGQLRGEPNSSGPGSTFSFSLPIAPGESRSAR